MGRKTEAYVDTSAFIAFADRSDGYHALFRRLFAEPPALVTTTLVKGTGPKVVKGEYVIAQYVGYIWRTKKVFGSSWSTGSPFGFVIGASPEQVIPGWDKGLVGQTVGSRVMLSIPPAQGYGSAGASQAGIKGNDTLVFVVDIIDALKHG